MELKIGNLYLLEDNMAGYRIVRTVDGEKEYNELGLSAGFIHYADPVTGEKLGHCGTSYFEHHSFDAADLAGCEKKMRDFDKLRKR